MPRRTIPFFSNEYYHVFNRGNNKQTIFQNHSDYQRLLDVICFYIPAKPGMKFSHFNKLSLTAKSDFLSRCDYNNKNIELLSYCLMPNHFHLLVKQKIDNGITHFMSQIQNSYTRYINTKYNKVGHIFQGQFKAVHIATDEQLLHVSRYIHLNPYASKVIKSIQELVNYPWSSLPEYLFQLSGPTFTETLLSYMSNEQYKDFIVNQADYQQTLNQLKHLYLD